MKVMYFSKKETLVRVLYSIGIYMAELLLKCIAPFSPKLKLGVEGRARTFKILKNAIPPQAKTFWWHCASLGEYEQGLPVFRALRKRHPDHKIVLTFFSPSGYEIRKNTDVADVVVYLPMDTKANAKSFLDLVHPQLTIFVKYDIWPNYLSELKNRHLKAILISAVFRKDQSYFQWYGSMMRKALSSFEQIFVQDEASKNLLEKNHFENVTVAGDTRFDRVSHQFKQDNHLEFIKAFKNDELCLVIGSSWPEDEALLIPFINRHTALKLKYIIAPHNINKGQIKDMQAKLKPKSLLYSEKEGKQLANYTVFIIDAIGLLSKIYSAADIAYVGGAMGTTGLHNILEPAVFGVPIIIGKNHEKFPEAQRMIDTAGLKSVATYNELDKLLLHYFQSEEHRTADGQRNSRFIASHKGAVHRILLYLGK